MAFAPDTRRRWRQRPAALGPNLLAAARDFAASASWVTGGAGATVTSNATAGPDGAVLADRLSDGGTTSAMRRQQAVAVTSGKAYQASIHLKADTARYAALEIIEGSRDVVIDLQTGSILSQNMTSATATSVGNGWWRIDARFTASSATATFRVYPAYADTLSLTAVITTTGAAFVDMASLQAVL